MPQKELPKRNSTSRWYRKLYYFVKSYNSKSPDYLFKLVLSYETKNLLIFLIENEI